MHIPSAYENTPLVSLLQESMMSMQNNFHLTVNGDEDIGVGNKLNFYPAVDEDYETRRAEQQAESLIPLKEDLAEWIQRLLDIPITTETFIQALDNGAALCRIAFLIQSKAEAASREGKCSETIPRLRFRCRENAKSRTWYARDNTANFLRWCRDFGINEGCMFESEDLVCHRQEKPVVVCLLELARLGYRFGLEPPSIVKIEKEIEREESELASQLNDDMPNGDEEDIGDEAGDSESGRMEEGDGEREEMNGTEEEGENHEGEEEEEGEEGGGGGEEGENSVATDGMNGNAEEDHDASSDGYKSRATSRATSHLSARNDNEEDNEEIEEDEEKENEEGEEEEGGETEEEEREEDGEEGEGINGTVNGISEDENGNEEDRSSLSDTKSENTRPNSPTKNDCGPTSPTRKSPSSPRSRIDNIKARQLDKKVKHIASEHNVSEHVSQISEGKYCIFGRVVFIRLLKEKHLMVRVGGGWDTLDHYLSHHSPTKILEFKRTEQTKSPNSSPKHDPDTGETATAGTNNTGDEKYLVISGKYKQRN